MYTATNIHVSVTLSQCREAGKIGGVIVLKPHPLFKPLLIFYEATPPAPFFGRRPATCVVTALARVAPTRRESSAGLSTATFIIRLRAHFRFLLYPTHSTEKEKKKKERQTEKKRKRKVIANPFCL
jgi:hypothetical protein